MSTNPRQIQLLQTVQQQGSALLEPLAELLANADAAMYSAKSARNSRIPTFVASMAELLGCESVCTHFKPNDEGCQSA